MDLHYVIRLGNHIAIADLCELEPGVMTMHRINVPAGYRSKGYGSKLLKMVIEAADAEGKIIELGVSSSGPLDNDALFRWYERNGFEREIGTANAMMRRSPLQDSGVSSEGDLRS